MRLRSLPKRHGATLVECAVVYPLTFFIILSMIIGAMGIFRFQEMAHLARDAARWGSVHGNQYRRDAATVNGTPTYWPGDPGTAETAGNTPLNTGTAPYNVAPWTTILWYQTSPTGTGGTSTAWADEIYDNAVRDKTFLLDPANLQMWVGWTPIMNLPTKPDNYPGSRITVTIKYPVFPEAFIWWYPGGNNFSVSTAPMPITN